MAFPNITAGEYAELSANYGGFCVECGDEAYGIEPDARRYECESCEAPAVYGIEELLMMGAVFFIDENEE